MSSKNKTVSDSATDALFVFVDDDDHDTFIFADDDSAQPTNKDDCPSQTVLDSPQEPVEAWKVLIVDDDDAVHRATILALQDCTFGSKPLTFFHAHSGVQAKHLIQAHPDTALILLDVVMEKHDAGLQVVQYIRKELNNHQVRIILRTGHPGEAPEASVILDYDINDYRLKTDLTRQKLITVVIASLRSYHNILTIENQNSELAHALDHLQQTQAHLIQAEKMSGLGQVVAGVAHEINNPINFISANLVPANEYFTSLIELINLYQQLHPQPMPEIQAKIAKMELEFLIHDWQKLMESMSVGTDRIKKIVLSLRNFSRLDEAENKPVDIHSGIDSTLLILQHRLKANGNHPEITVIKEYGQLPLVNCYVCALNQVFMNILSNGIDALEMGIGERRLATGDFSQFQIPIIRIRTQKHAESVLIRIADNGSGMSESILKRIFDPFFTTKPVGRGTGLGLSISYSIVVQQHGGRLTCSSAPGEGAEFVIQIPIGQLQS